MVTLLPLVFTRANAKPASAEQHACAPGEKMLLSALQETGFAEPKRKVMHFYPHTVMLQAIMNRYALLLYECRVWCIILLTTANRHG